jgi:hypothetical protein
MNDENKLCIRQRIDEVAKMLQLPPSPRHPKGRNPHAHLAQVIKHACGMSYTQLPDDALPIVMEIIECCEENPF